MGFFKNLFWGTKSEEENKSNIPEKKELDTPQTIGGVICDHCEKEIFSHEKIRNFCKKKYHIKCLRRMKKDAKKMAFQ